MPVTKITAGQQSAQLSGGSTSHTMSVPLNINPSALPYTYGIAAYGWNGDYVSVSGDPITCQWDGEDVIDLLAAPLLFNSNHSLLMGWIVESPTSGNVTMSHTGIGTGLDTRARYFTAGVWAQAVPLDLDNIQAAVVSAVGSTSVATSGVTVPSNRPASRVIAAHMVGPGRKITDYNGTRIAAPAQQYNGGQLLLGERRGDTSVSSTATHSANTGSWAAFGLNLDPATVSFGAGGKTKVGTGRFGGSVYRLAEPHPDREYTVPPLGSADPDVIGGGFYRTASGVPMPIYIKDPDDTLEYTFHWQNHIADDDEIDHVQHIPEGSLRVFSEFPNSAVAADPADRATTQVWLTGATVGLTYKVRIRLYTKKGRVQDWAFYVRGAQNG